MNIILNFLRYKLVKNDEVIVKDRDIVELHKTDYIYVLSVFFLSILFIMSMVPLLISLIPLMMHLVIIAMVIL